MINLKTFNASEARANLFKIFKLVSKGEEVVVINNDTEEKFKISRFEDEPRVDKVAIAKKMGKIGFKAKPWAEMKTIIETRLDLNLDNE
jgi:hypothetical protein